MSRPASLAIGRARIDFSWPEGSEPELLAPPPGPGGPTLDLETEARRLAHDLSIARGTEVLVVVPDRTRNFPLERVLPALVAELVLRGVPESSITIAAASGTHRGDPADLAPSRTGVLPRGVARLAHDASRGGVDFGVSTRGTHAEVHAAVREADAIAALGGTAFHYFAGFGGGWKLLFPGLGMRAAIAANHRLSLGGMPPGGLASGVGPGMLAGNPVAEDLREIATLLPPVRQLTLWRNGHGYDGGRWSDPAGFVSLCERFADSRRQGEAHAFDIVVASAGGWPRDIDLVQAHKALFHASLYARDGAILVLAAQCEEGVGSASLVRWLTERDLPVLEERARASYDLNAQTAISLATIARRVAVRWIAQEALPALAGFGVVFEQNLEAAVSDALARHRARASAAPRIAFLPEAGEVVPGWLPVSPSTQGVLP